MEWNMSKERIGDLLPYEYSCNLLSLIPNANNYGSLDLVLAGNFYVSEPETPKNDAGMGLVLLGNGNREFSPIAPSESGLMIPYDVRSMEKINIPSLEKEALLIGSNNQPLKALLME